MTKTLQTLCLLTVFIFSINTSSAQFDYDTVNFEQPTDKLVIDELPGNIWQIGEPDKDFFSESHDGINAIVTDTLNSYPTGNTSSFRYIMRRPFTESCISRMDFWHKYDTDSLNDIGTIDASYDGGITWVPVNDTSYEWSSYFYWEWDYHEATGEYTPHNLKITGKSDGWVKSSFTWHWWIAVRSTDTIIINPDSLIIRFTFSSDNVQENREGWMIDEIIGSSIWGSLCSGTNEIPLEKNMDVFPNPFNSNATLRFKDELVNAEVYITNAYGGVVISQTGINGKEYFIGRNNLKAGIYLVHLRQDGKIKASKRLVITD